MRHESRTRRYRRWLRWLLVASIAVAAVLRFAGLGFGRAVLTARADEELLRSGVLISLGGDLNPHYAVWGHLFHYLYTLLAAIWLAFQVWAGQVRSWTDGLAAMHCEPATFVWIGRAISAAAGVLTVVATYQLARRSLASRLVAACACVLLSTLFLHVRDSHFATSDVLLGLFCTAALAAMARRGGPRVGWAGLWTGLALATKLLSVTIALTFLTCLVLRHRIGQRQVSWTGRPWLAVRFLAVAAAVAIVTQPFLLLDPMETWFGLFGDLFNPERRPFEHGLSLINAKIIVRYYLPQAMGWPVGGLAAFGGLTLLSRVRFPQVAPILIYTVWSLLALVSVERIFLRYLDPLLPVICVLAAHGIVRITRWLRQQRLVLAVAATALVAAPNLVRAAWLDVLLFRSDTRALAAEWIEQNVPSGSRILWSGYGSIAPHLTMPWLHTPVDYDRQHIAERRVRGLPVEVDEAIVQWKRAFQVPSYRVVGLVLSERHSVQSGIDAYPFLDHRYDLPLLDAIDRWSRGAGLLRRESPRWELMRRHVVEVVEIPVDALGRSDEEFVVLTGMPCDPVIAERLGAAFDVVQVFEPGVPWPEYRGRVMYDLGDAWYLPNLGLHRVERPGPEIMIFRRRAN